MVVSISAGRWLTSIMPTPYFLPSLAIRRTTLEAEPSLSRERYAWASSRTIRSGRSRPPSGRFLAQNIASYNTRSIAPIRSFRIFDGIPERSRIETGRPEPIQSHNNSSTSLTTPPSSPGDQSPGRNKKANLGSRNFDARDVSWARIPIVPEPSCTRSSAGPVVLTVLYSGGRTVIASPKSCGCPALSNTYACSTSPTPAPGFGMSV